MWFNLRSDLHHGNWWPTDCGTVKAFVGSDTLDCMGLYASQVRRDMVDVIRLLCSKSAGTYVAAHMQV